VDTAGNLFVADTNANRVRKVNTQGVITTIAGNGQGGFSGDGAAAVNAAIQNPQDVAVDSVGNLYIAATGQNRVRKVSPAGVISTFAGNGSAVYSGDGGPATSAGVGNPHSLALDAAGNLYILDNAARIRKVSPDGTITTFGGPGNSALRKVSPRRSPPSPQGGWRLIPLETSMLRWALVHAWSRSARTESFG